MREIKFRVWSKPSNKMYFQLKESPCFGLFEGDRAVSIEDVFFYEPQDFELMQYTGLKDKSGKEIYEGDIVRVHEGEDFKWEEKVEYFNGCFTVGDNALGALNHFSEVIGNIYENPELLEGESR